MSTSVETLKKIHMNDASPKEETPDANQGSTDLINAAREALHRNQPEAVQGNGMGQVPGLDGGMQSGSNRNTVLAGKTARALLACVDATLGRRIYDAGFKLSHDPEFAQNIAAECALQKPELELFQELVEQVAEKYSLASQFAPEIGLAAILGAYGFRINSTLKKLDHYKAQNTQPTVLKAS